MFVRPGPVVVGLVIATSCTTIQSNTAPEGSTQEASVGFVGGNAKGWPLPEEIGAFEAADGASLRYARWPAPDPERRAGIVVFFQGRTEFIEKNIYTYQDLLDDNYEIWTLDWRGQGLSERMLKEEPEKGHIDSFETFIDDAETFIDDIVKLDQQTGTRKILLAHSMGGGIGTLYLMRHPQQFDRAVFSSPLIRLPGLVDNGLIRFGNALKNAMGPSSSCAGIFADCSWQSDFKEDVDPCSLGEEIPESAFVDAVDSQQYSHDAGKVAEINCLIDTSRTSADAGPNLGLGGSTSGWLHAAFDATDQIEQNRAELETPLLIVGAGAETVVNNDGQTEFCDGHPSCCRIQIEGAGHEILIETEDIRARFLNLFRAFVTTDESAPAFCEAMSDE